MAVRGLGTACLSAAAAAVVLLGTIGVEACSCGERTLCETFEFSTVVMQVSPFSRSNSTNNTTSFNEFTTYGVDVLAVYKGESGVDYGDNNTFLTESGGSFCGVFLELDTEYLIDFSRDEDDGLLHASACGLARAWSSVDAVDLADLESGCGTTNSTTTMTDDDEGASDGAGGTTNSTTTMADDDGGASDGAGGTTNGTSTDDSNSSGSDEEETPADEQAENSSLRRVSLGSFGAMVAFFTSFMALGFGV